MKEQLAQMIEQVNCFYPVIDDYQKKRSKLNEYTEILTHKINQIIEGEVTAWTNFITSLEENLKFKFLDLNFQQFASHIARADIEKDFNSHYDFQSSIVISVSLLCDFYTFHFEDTFTFKKYNEKRAKPQLRIIFLEDRNEMEYKTVIADNIVNQMSVWFPNHTYAHHKFLMEYKLYDRVPYTENLESIVIPYSIYNFLFDGFFKEDWSHILK